MNHDSSAPHGMPPLAPGGAWPTSRGSAALSPGSPVRLIRQLSTDRQQQAERNQAAAAVKKHRSPSPGQAQATSSTKHGTAADKVQSKLGSSRKAKGHSSSHAASSSGTQALPPAERDLPQPPAQDNGPASPEEGIDQCMAALAALSSASSSSNSSGNGNQHAIKTEALLTVHRLNMCFMAARSFTHAVALAERAAFGKSLSSDSLPSHEPAAAPASVPSEEAAASGAGLMRELTEMLHHAEPHAILALNCLSFLTASPLVVRRLLVSAGLVPLLLGHLRHGRSLEPLLVSSALSLLVTLIHADAQHMPRQIVPRHMASLAAVAACFLGQCQQPQCQDLALQLVEELAVTHAGAQLVRSHEALGQAMELAAATAVDRVGDQAQAMRFRKRLLAAQKLAAMLAPSGPLQN